MSSNVTDFGPDDLLSSPREGTRRAKVEHDQTAFFEGRIFRTFKEWQVATTAVYTVKVVTPINLVLSTLGIQLDQGSARLESLIQVTEGGSFSEVLPKFAVNYMTTVPHPVPTSQITVTAGGTVTGGMLLDPLRIKTGNNSNFATSVGGASNYKIGIAPGTYYLKLTLTDAIGVLRITWEEYP